MGNTNNCLEINSDRCVLYTGPDYLNMGIKSGEYYDKVFVDFLKAFNDFVSAKFHLGGLYTAECDNCEEKVNQIDALNVLIKKLNNLNASDLTYSNSFFSIGADTLSTTAANLLGGKFTYSVSPLISGSAVTYDLTSVTKSLPDGYRVSAINTILSGKPERGSNIIVDSSKAFTAIDVGNDRFPLILDVSIRINTPTGDVKLSSSVSIPSPLSGTYTAEFDVKDFGSVSRSFKLSEFVEAMAAEIHVLKTEVGSYSDMRLSESYLKSKDKGLKSIVGILHSAISDLNERVSALEKISFTYSSTACGTNTVETSISEALGILSSTCTQLQEQVCQNGGCG